MVKFDVKKIERLVIWNGSSNIHKTTSSPNKVTCTSAGVGHGKTVIP
jgi:hypothetical protein